jgi:hypothetical protein
MQEAILSPAIPQLPYGNAIKFGEAYKVTNV